MGRALDASENWEYENNNLLMCVGSNTPKKDSKI